MIMTGWNMSNWNNRLRSKMKELGLTQEELARKLGVTRSAVAHYVQGTRQPPIKQVIKLAAILKTEPAWLQFGKPSEASQPPAVAMKKATGQIPIISWEQVSNFVYQPERSNNEQHLAFFHLAEPGCYALLIKGDSMVSSLGQGISLSQGSYIVVDPNKEPTHRSIVLATTKSKKEPILRQYIEEGGTIYLKPLNPQYPLIELDRNTKLVGVVIANIQFT